MEGVLLSVCLVRGSCEVAEATEDLHLVCLERRLHPEGAPGPTLTGKAVTDGNHKRIPGDLQTQLSTVTGGFPGSHRNANVLKRRLPSLSHAIEARRRYDGRVSAASIRSSRASS